MEKTTINIKAKAFELATERLETEVASLNKDKNAKELEEILYTVDKKSKTKSFKEEYKETFNSYFNRYCDILSGGQDDSFEIFTDEGVPFPKYETTGAVGLDVTAQNIKALYNGPYKSSEKVLSQYKTYLENGTLLIKGHERVLIGTGIQVNLPLHLELQVRPRSGLALKHGLSVLNSPGTIDSDYKGEIGIILVNTTPYPINVPIKKGDRIAQLVPKEVSRPILNRGVELTKSDRGDKGFGSTGVESKIKDNGKE